jgi:heat shock protein HslJ
MKNIFWFLIITVAMVSCKPTKTSVEAVSEATVEVVKKDPLLGTNWRLTGVAFHEKDLFLTPPEKEKGLTFSFLADGRLAYRLSVNNCNGTYQYTDGGLKIGAGGCTKMCCDSDFAADCQRVLATVERYALHDDTHLDLIGTEKILKLERVDE